MKTKKIIKDYMILRGLKTGPGLRFTLIDRKPVRVATIIDEPRLMETKQLIHHHTVFLEDQIHDWDYSEHTGKFRYYSRVADVADVILVFEFEEVPDVPKFDPMTGQPL